jgi:hypothetical protein
LYPARLKNRPHEVIESDKISSQISANKNIELIFIEKNNICFSFREDQTAPGQQWQTDWSLQREWEAGNHGDGSCCERLYCIYIDCLELTSHIRRDVLHCCPFFFYFEGARNDDEGMKFVEDNNLFALIFSSDFFSVFSSFPPPTELGRIADPGFVVDV